MNAGYDSSACVKTCSVEFAACLHVWQSTVSLEVCCVSRSPVALQRKSQHGVGNLTFIESGYAWSLQDEVKILRRIGEGAFGEVSLATCAIFGSVAVKWLKVPWLTLFPMHNQDPADSAGTQDSTSGSSSIQVL